MCSSDLLQEVIKLSGNLHTSKPLQGLHDILGHDALILFDKSSILNIVQFHPVTEVRWGLPLIATLPFSDGAWVKSQDSGNIG